MSLNLSTHRVLFNKARYETLPQVDPVVGRCTFWIKFILHEKNRKTRLHGGKGIVPKYGNSPVSKHGGG